MAFDFAQAPKKILEVRKLFEQDAQYTPYSNYLNGVQWCPDGQSVLTASADNKFRVVQVPEADDENKGKGSDLEVECQEIQAGEMVFDYCWYPYADARTPQSYCFLSTCRGHPVHLWDVQSGLVRASYRCYNAQDEVMTCTSLGCTADGARIYCGAKNCLYVFDISRPGRDYTFVSTFSKTEGGIRGLISAMAFCKADPKVYAVGSYSGSIGLFSAETDTLQLHLEGHTAGVTKVLFSADGHFLYTGARCDSALMCWDFRFTGQPVYTLQRNTQTTTQRIHFDIEPITGRHLVTGEENGHLAVFDLRTGTREHQIPISVDTLNGAAFHPWKTCIATASGSRHFAKVHRESLDDNGIDHRLTIVEFPQKHEEGASE